MKKIISLFLVLVTILSISATAVSAEDTAITGKCGDNITYTYDEKTETLYIEGTGKMYDYLDYYEMKKYLNGEEYSKEYQIQPEAFNIAKKIEISDGITYIGKNAFANIRYDDAYIEDLKFGKDVEEIGEQSFSFRGIINIVLPDKLEVVRERAFYVSYVENLTFGSSIKKIEKEAFYWNRLKNIVIPDSVETIGKGAFSHSDVLESVVIGRSVKTVGSQAFLTYSHSNFPVVLYKIPENVTKIGKQAFGYIYHADGLNYSAVTPYDIIEGKVGSAVYEYCQKNGVNFDDVDGCEKDAHIFGNKQCIKEKVCKKTDGIDAVQCIKCGTRRYEHISKDSHDFAEVTTKTVKKPTYFKKGTDKTYCTTCKKYIEIKTPKAKIPEPEVKITKGKTQVTITFKNDENEKKLISYYKVSVDDYYSNDNIPSKTYTVKGDKITIKNLKANKKYHFEFTAVYEKNGKTAKNTIVKNFKTKK